MSDREDHRDNEQYGDEDRKSRAVEDPRRRRRSPSYDESTYRDTATYSCQKSPTDMDIEPDRPDSDDVDPNSSPFKKVSHPSELAKTSHSVATRRQKNKSESRISRLPKDELEGCQSSAHSCKNCWKRNRYRRQHDQAVARRVRLFCHDSRF